jgi:uncharacterized cupredoxin-like copper-binding protein
MKKIALLFCLGVLVGLLAGCASPTPEPVSIDLHMSEYAFTPNAIEVKVGQPVTLNLINDGQLAHEVMFGKEVNMIENRPSGYHTDMFEAAGMEPGVTMAASEPMEGEMEMHEAEHTGFMVVLPKTGDQATMTFTPTEAMLGEWEMGCFEQDGVHYQAGMKGVFTVSN